MNPSCFALLVNLFRNRLFEDDSAGAGIGFQTNIYQVLGFLLAAGWFIAYFLMPPLLRLSTDPQSAQTEWAIFTLRMLFPSFSFAIVGFAAMFEWDTLFPDRRDFLVLGTLPVSPWQMFAARLSAIGWLLLLLMGAFNVFPIGMTVVLSILVPGLHGLGWQLVLAQLAATTAASVFALVSVAALQGVLINVLSPCALRRLSPIIQMLGMSVMILCALYYPLYSMLARVWATTNDVWPWLLPPVWFTGVYAVIVPGRTELFAAYGMHGLVMLGAMFVFASVAWICGYSRHYRRTLEFDQTQSRSRSRLSWPSFLFGTEEERAMGAFTFRTLASSNKHRLFLATYLSVGLAMGTLFAVAVRSGKLMLSTDGVRAFPFLIVFFVISGFRAVSQFPAELPANWLFRLAEAHWSEAARCAVRKQVLLFGLAPALLLALPVQLAVCDWRDLSLHAAFQLLAGALLVEAMFWRFDKVPFTCSYFPGRTNLSLLAGFYLYGFTSYSFHLAAVERNLEGNAPLAGVVLAAGGALLAQAWHRNAPATQLRFDGEEPLIRTLDLH